MMKVKVGILGCANIAQRMVLPALKELEEFEVIGVASRTADKAKLFAELFQIPAYSSYDDLLNTELDAVYIPLPNSLHYEWIKKSLNKGLHVLVEKSLGCSYQEVEELNQLAQQKRLVLIENFQFRFHSQLQVIQDKIQTGTIGELRNVRSSFGFPPFPDADNIRYKKALGGGALLDAAAYPVKISQIILGTSLEVTAAKLNYPAGKEVDIWGSAYLQQIDGQIASQIAFGFDNFYQNNLEVWGTKGKLIAHRIFTAGPGVEPLITIETPTGKEEIVVPQENHFKHMLVYFYQQITTQTNIQNEYEQNINQARLLSELYEKSK